MSESQLWPPLRRYWHPVAVASEIEDKPHAAQLLDERLVLVRLNGNVVCFRDLCIHRGTALSLGWVERDTLVCAYHGWTYDAAGRCTLIPSLPAGRSIPRKARADVYRVAERYGLIWVCLDEPVAPIPDFPEYGDPKYDPYLIGPLRWQCSAARAVENYLDQAHIPWVHEGILGDRRYPETKRADVERHREELRYTLEGNFNPQNPDVHDLVYRVHRPFTIHSRRVYRTREGETAMFFTVTPHTAKTSTNYMFTTRSFPLTQEEKDEQRRLDELVMSQDQAIVESQRPEELPLDLAEELHIKGPDAVAIEYRRFMAEIGMNIDARE